MANVQISVRTMSQPRSKRAGFERRNSETTAILPKAMQKFYPVPNGEVNPGRGFRFRKSGGADIICPSEYGRITMPELTLESLERRLAEVERQLNERYPNVIPASRDWRSVVGISEETEFSRQMQAELVAMRDADRRAAEEDQYE